MIKFIIVEDDLHFQKDIIEVIKKLMFNTQLDYLLEPHSKYGKELSASIKDCSVRKIYILDIELDEKKSGIEIASEIRESDWDSEIIFLTSHDKMFETVYRTVLKVFDFIEKFYHFKTRLEKDLKLIVNKKEDFAKFRFENNKVKMQIYLKDITHIYRDTHERKLIIQTTNNRFLVNITIADILKELDARFRQIHRACIVNTDRVNKYCWRNGYFILDNGERVDLCSKNFQEKIK